MRRLIKRLNPLWILLATLAVFSCANDLSKDPDFGLVKMFHGKPMPPRMIPRSVLGSSPSGPFDSHILRGVMIMDSGADYQGQTSLTYMAELLERYNFDKQGDLPFHYFIDTDGIIYAGRQYITPALIFEGDAFTKRKREVATQSDLIRARMARHSKKPLNVDGFLVIMLLGDFDERLVNEKQEQALFQLLAHRLFRHQLPRESIVLLSALHPETNNPGFYLKNYLNWSTLEQNLPPPPAKHPYLIKPGRPSGR